MPRIRSLFLALLIGYSPAVLAESGAPDYMPIEPGRSWFYDGDLGTDQLMTVEGFFDIFGEQTTVRLHENTGTSPDLFQNFWTKNAEGDVFLHGAENIDSFVKWGYDPPLKWIDAPLTVGKTWTVVSRFCPEFDLGLCEEETFSLTFLVVSEGLVVVPAGSFNSLEVQQVETPPVLEVSDHSKDRFTIFGRRLTREQTADGGADVEFYSDGVGIVRHDTTGEVFDLVATDPSTPTESSTWSRIKSLYR